MSDTPEARARAAAARPATAGRAGAGRTVHVAASDPQRRADARSAPRRSSASRSNARWVGFLAVVVVDPVHHRSTGSTSSAPLGLTRAAARRGGQRPAGHLGRARLQPVRGQLRALPRRERRGRHRPGAQPPGQAVRPPVGRLPQQRADRRRPLRLRQRQLASCRSGRTRAIRRAAQLHPDRRPDRVHPRARATRPTRSATPRSASRRPTRSPARSETFNGWVDSTTSRAPGATPFPACWSDEFAAPSGAPSGRPRPRSTRRATGRRSSPSGHRVHDADLTAPADKAFVIDFDNQDAGHAAQHRDQGLGRRGQVHRARRSTASPPSPTRCRRSRPGPTRSCAPCTRR